MQHYEVLGSRLYQNILPFSAFLMAGAYGFLEVKDERASIGSWSVLMLGTSIAGVV
jgi:hypothetical protein